MDRPVNGNDVDLALVEITGFYLQKVQEDRRKFQIKMATGVGLTADEELFRLHLQHVEHNQQPLGAAFAWVLADTLWKPL